MAIPPPKKLSEAEEIVEIAAAEIIKKILMEQLEILDAVEPKNFDARNLSALEDLAKIFKLLKEDLRDDLKAETFSQLGLRPNGKPAQELQEDEEAPL